MMKKITLEQVAEACGGTYIGPENRKTQTICGVAIDSRKAEKNYLFVAIKGEKVDGHRFAPAVLEAGAAAALVENCDTEYPGPVILVKSTTQALKDLAEYYRSILNVKVVGITGSVGKTSTKETIASVLEQKYKVLKTEGNFNNEIGLPLTVFKITEEHEVAVLEMGISEFGEMERLSKIARPDIEVITNIGVCHLENLKTRDGILKAKTEMFQNLKPGGTVILNGDDDKLRTVTEVHGEKPVFFGIREDGKLQDERIQVYAEHIKNLGLEGMEAGMCIDGEETEIHITTPGRHNVYNALAAACVGRSLGLTTEEISRGIAKAGTIQGRTNLIHTDKFTIIDDCYNANPVSMKEALNVLNTAPGRKIAVLGDMGELGKNEEDLHYEVGEHLAGTDIDTLFCAGKLSGKIAEAVRKAGKGQEIFFFETKDKMKETLMAYVKKGDTILVKASHFMEFPEIVDILKQM